MATVTQRVTAGRHGGRSRKLADHIFTHTQEVGGGMREKERIGSWLRLQNLKAHPSDVLPPGRIYLLKVSESVPTHQVF